MGGDLLGWVFRGCLRAYLIIKIIKQNKIKLNIPKEKADVEVLILSRFELPFFWRMCLLK